MTVSVNLSNEPLTPNGNVLEIRESVATNGVFINVDFTPRFGVILPGFDMDAVHAARQMAAKLHELAYEAERKIAAVAL